MSYAIANSILILVIYAMINPTIMLAFNGTVKLTILYLSYCT